MRHLVGFVLALTLLAALFFGAGWGVAKIIELRYIGGLSFEELKQFRGHYLGIIQRNKVPGVDDHHLRSGYQGGRSFGEAFRHGLVARPLKN